MPILYTQHVASAPNNHICLPTADCNTEVTFYNFNLMKLTRMNCKITNNPGILAPLHHVWAFPVWSHQTAASLRLPVLPSAIQRRGQNRIRVDSCWCALCLSREEKFANGTDTGSRQQETCSWPEINTTTGTISATHATLGQCCKVFCEAASETRCCL